MVRGQPGTGKSLLGAGFLAEDPTNALYVSFEESADALRANAGSVGIDLSDVTILDLSPESDAFVGGASYDLFADDVDGVDVTESVVEAVDEHDPDRVFVDPLTHLREFAPDDYRFRTEVAGFMRYLKEHGATVLFSTQPSAAGGDDDLQFIADGALTLSRDGRRRTLAVEKFRGSDFDGGEHTLRITGDGISVYPVLVPKAHSRTFENEILPMGVEEFDELLGGGLNRGTVTIVAGPSGVGKTTTAAQFAAAAAERGERAAMYLFEEAESVLRHRTSAVGIPLPEMAAAGHLHVSEVEPLEASPDEFAATVREEVEEEGASVVVLDGISGYRLSMLGEPDRLVRELHALCRYLRNMGVTVILIDEVDSVTGDFNVTSERTSYLADNIVFLRYFEAEGEIRKAAGVLKKRAGDFERTLREFIITTDGITLGAPLTGMRGVLTGTPNYDESDL